MSGLSSVYRDRGDGSGDEQEMVSLTTAVDGVETPDACEDSSCSPPREGENACNEDKQTTMPWWVRRGPSVDVTALTQTLTYTLGFGVLGLLVGLIGPSLPTLRDNVGVSFESLGIVFLARWLGGVTGSALGSMMLDRVPRSHAPMCGGIIVATLGAVCIPAARSLPALLFAFLVMDLGLGILIVYGNTLGTWANPTNPGPAVNVINGGFGLGALIAPLIVYTVLEVGVGVTGAYWVVAAAAIATAVGCLRVIAPPRPSDPESERTDLDENGGVVVNSDDAGDNIMRGQVGHMTAVGATTLFIALVVGVETSYGSFLVSYCLDIGGAVKEKEADLVTTAFWTTFTLGRFAVAAVSHRVRPAPLLLGHLIAVCAALFIVFVGRGSRASVWIGSVIFGAGMSSVFAASVAHLNELVGPAGMSGRVGGWISVGASCGTLVMLATSKALGSPDMVMATLLVLSIASLGTMAGVWAIVGWRSALWPVTYQG